MYIIVFMYRIADLFDDDQFCVQLGNCYNSIWTSKRRHARRGTTRRRSYRVGVSVDSDVYYRVSLLFIVVWSSGSVARSSRSIYTDVYIIAAIAREILPIAMIITTIIITAVITVKPAQQFHFIPARHAFYAYVSYCINIRIGCNESFFQLSDNLSALETCVY